MTCIHVREGATETGDTMFELMAEKVSRDSQAGKQHFHRDRKEQYRGSELDVSRGFNRRPGRTFTFNKHGEVPDQESVDRLCNNDVVLMYSISMTDQKSNRPSAFSDQVFSATVFGSAQPVQYTSFCQQQHSKRQRKSWFRRT